MGMCAMSEPEHLFVYGTLRAACAGGMSTLLQPGTCSRGAARMRARLFDLGAYPGLVPTARPGRWVHGELHALTHPATVLQRLDRYEGCAVNDPEPHEFVRIAAEVMQGNRPVPAWVYVYQGATAGCREISCGDYLRARR